MKELEIFDRKILISDNLALYNKLRKKFYASIIEYEDFFKYQLNELNSIEELLRKIPDIADVCIEKVIEIAIDTLIDYKIYDYDLKRFSDIYEQEFFDYSEYYIEVENAYLKILGKEQEMQTNRKIQRSGRSKWYGGGFGVKGAIKGAATAGALNIGTGILRGIGDSVVDSNDRNKINKLKRQLFESREVREYLINGIITCMGGVFYALLDLLENLLNINFNVFDADKANAIYNNVQNYINDDEEFIDGIVQCINLYPYNSEYYKILIDKFYDKDNEIEIVADYFGIDVRNYKSILVNSIKKSLNFSNEENAIKSKEKLIKFIELISYEDDSINEYIKSIDKTIKELNEKARTVNGVLYSSKEIANEVRSEIAILDGIKKETNFEDKQSLINSKKRIIEANFKTNIQSEFLDKIEEKIEELDQLERTVHILKEVIVYDDLETAELVRKDIRDIEEIIKNTPRNKEDYGKLKSEIRFKKYHKDVIECYSTMLENTIIELEKEERTVDGVLFYDIERADNARKEKEKIDSIVEKIDENIEKTMLDAIEKIKKLECKSPLGDYKIQEINDRIKKLKQKYEQLKNEIEQRKRDKKFAKRVYIVIDLIGLYLFFGSGIIFKIIITIIILATIGANKNFNEEIAVMQQELKKIELIDKK